MKKRILCFGDSNTWGYIPQAGGRYEETARWTGLLAELLGERYAVIEEGMNARTTAFSDLVEPCVSGAEYIYPCLVSQLPLDWVVIMLGTNDTKQRYQVSANEIGRGMQELLYRMEDTFRRRNVRPRVLLVSPACLDAREDWTDFTEESAEKSRLLAGEYRALAAAGGYEFLDADAVVGREGVGEDGVHLSSEGHRRLARALAQLLAEPEGE